VIEQFPIAKAYIELEAARLMCYLRYVAERWQGA